MEINNFTTYSCISETENKKNDENDIVNKFIEDLYNINYENEAKEYIHNLWGIKDDVQNFAISSNVHISTCSMYTYYNITVESENSVKSFNFKKGDNNEQY